VLALGLFMPEHLICATRHAVHMRIMMFIHPCRYLAGPLFEPALAHILLGILTSTPAQEQIMYGETNNTGLIPLKMCSAVVALDQFYPGWTLADVENSETPEPRRFEHYIWFDAPFANVPLVHTGIAGFDIDNADTGRLSVRAEEISNTGFKLVVMTWLHLFVYGIEVSWLALGNA
jgi:hypothetical protein